ncbi:receptor-like protein kinase [Tanacetum coccineum]
MMKVCLAYYYLSLASLVVSGLSFDGQTLLSLSTRWVSSSSPSLLSSWNASHANPCLWAGVVCDPTNLQVVALDLSDSQISGEIGPEISRLSQLKSLNLSFNDFSGPIPSQIGNCTRLQYLDLSVNSLTGNIPNTLGNLLTLKHLNLLSNSLNGSIPESIFHIPRLEILTLSDNQLTGFIPSNLGNATMLQELYIDNNQFTGSLPYSINNLESLTTLDAHSAGLKGQIPLGYGGCKKLNYLDLAFNQFCCGKRLTGTIPSSFGQLTKMSLLYLSENNLSGKIPPELGNCTSLLDLQLYTNQLEGSIPSELGMLNLTNLSLFTNRLTGEVPMSIWKIKSLEYLLLYENSLSGELPVEVAELKLLRNFTLFSNNFSGMIPQNLGLNATQLVLVDFLHNSFSGPIPPNLCSGKQLVKLVLGSNPLQGSIPDDIRNCPTLARLILKDSNLSGFLPDVWDNPNLLYLDLSNNYFTGQIPATFADKLTNITEINLSMNRLSGVLPQELGRLLQLQGFNLSYNAFEGPLPSQLANCTKLLNFDASHNMFNGSIPTALRTMYGLLNLDLSENHLIGSIPSFISGLQGLIQLRLGGNLLGGTIPSSIIELKKLGKLNISNNGLKGDIPSGFSKLEMLEQLDVSHNHLTGTLASLAELRALTQVNISYNLFTGQIPASLLNSSFNSFVGNPSLCVDCVLNNCDANITRNLKRCMGASLKKQKGLTKFETGMVALGTSALLFAIVVGTGFILQYRQREKHDIEEMYNDKEEDDILFQKLMEATEDLDDDYIIGRGAHGTVYKASLGPKDGVYAVKKLMFGGSNKEGSTSMVREIETVGKVRHRNLVRLEEFWMRKDYGLILYRYMHNGSLHDILHEVHPPPLLDWNLRFNIALGTAHGLAYLHFDCDPAIVHRDIKPMNILLDAELEPHISDFGIAKLLDHSSPEELMSGTLRGTIGYIAPENAFTSTKSMESDVYSYGVVLLELITRKKAADDTFTDEGLDIVRWVRSVWSENKEIDVVVDKGLYDDLYDSFVREQVTQVLQLALRCTQTEPSRRPSMREVVKQLEDVYASTSSGSKLK